MSKKIEEHKHFFNQLPEMQESFQIAKKQIGGEESSVPPQQVEYMDLRLRTVAPRAALRKINLQYLEHRVSETT